MNSGPFNFVPILIGALGLLVAFFVGITVGEGDFPVLLMVFGLLGMILIVAFMRQRVWVLLAMFWGFTGSVYVLPLRFSVRDLVVLLVTAIACALFALRIFKFRNSWKFLDAILFLNVAQVALAFLFHPVGLRSMSSSTVGAKPYFNVVIALVAYLILSNQIAPPKLARALPVFVFIPEAISSCISLLVRVVPRIGLVLGYFYSDFFPPLSVQGGGVERISIGSGSTLVRLLCSYFRPLSTINPLRPLRLFLLLLGLVLILISGFRSTLLSAAAIFLLSCYLRNGWKDLLAALAGISLVIAALVLFNATVHPLPLPIQRTLSFLPGTWDSRAREDAAGSTEWRLQMWRDLTKGNKYIQDKIMGDGFGFSRMELQAMERQNYSTGPEMQEYFMIIGAFHNGPLSAIRYVGVVGLLLYYALMITTAIYAYRLIRRATRSDFYPMALFYGLGLIWEPLNYTLIFGAYDSGLPDAIFAVGILKLLHNSLVAYPPEERRKPRQPLPTSHGRSRSLAPA
ncbi:MAG: O-antigen ligase family protein [Verrucomicrobiota bacterium]|nr:O-antigen ligase family protein [Verrucomicrobiota bacterium]